jgi:hypothetical protein
MKMTKVFLTAVLALTPLVAFGQDQKKAPVVEQKSLRQLQLESQDGDKARSLANLADCRKKADRELAEYNDLTTTRVKLIEKLRRAIKDGDETLVKVAVMDALVNNDRIVRANQGSVRDSSSAALQASGSAYTSGYISEEEYTKDLESFRQVKTRIEDPTPPELVSLLEQARLVVPYYFALLQRSGFRLPADLISVIKITHEPGLFQDYSGARITLKGDDGSLEKNLTGESKQYVEFTGFAVDKEHTITVTPVSDTNATLQYIIPAGANYNFAMRRTFCICPMESLSGQRAGSSRTARIETTSGATLK